MDPINAPQSFLDSLELHANMTANEDGLVVDYTTRELLTKDEINWRIPGLDEDLLAAGFKIVDVMY